ncbi:MAG TPA: metallophosphoesterase [Candidatus Angelobacter sp.]
MRRLISFILTIAIVAFVLELYWEHSKTSVHAAGMQQAGTALTLPLRPNSVRFAVVGDNGTADSSEYQVGEQMQKAQQISKFNFVLMLGDNLYGGSSVRDYQDRFERPYKAMLDEGVIFYASLGNHDDNNEVSYAPFHMNGNRYYAYWQGNVEFFALDTNYMDGSQLDWLQKELRESTATWKIAYFHHPLYSSGKTHGSSRELRLTLEPLFEKYGVNVVLAGHDHVYERVVPQNGILYFVLGSSGKLRNGDLRNDSLKAAGFDSDRCFMLVEIAGDEFYYQTISRTGQTVDSGVFKRQAQAAATAPEAAPALR